jgi:hypothetical protein
MYIFFTFMIINTKIFNYSGYKKDKRERERERGSRDTTHCEETGHFYEQQHSQNLDSCQKKLFYDFAHLISRIVKEDGTLRKKKCKFTKHYIKYSYFVKI